jgi:hypothetical protein
MRIDLYATRPATKSGAELDATEHAQELVWNHGERTKIKTGMRRRNRRQARQALHVMVY